MTNPVPSASVGTPYGRRGSYWSCNEDAQGNGIHTGVDYPASTGTKVVAARGGTAHYCNHGSAFGNHQLEITPGDGTRDFYAHMTTRTVADGARVETGQQVGKVGAEGNVTGPHLHFERHKVASGGWSCSIITNPQPSIDYQSKPPPKPKPEEDMPKFSRTRLTKPLKVKENEWTTLPWDKVSSGDAGKVGEGYIQFGPSAFTATLSVQTTATGTGSIRTRLIERNKDDKGSWSNSEVYPGLEHSVTSGDTYLSDTRTQNVPKDTRLLAQVALPQDGTVVSAELNVLYF